MDNVTLHSIDTNRLKRNLGTVFKDVHMDQQPLVITRYRNPSVILFPMHYSTKVETLALRGCPGGALITPAWFKDHLCDTIKEVFFGFKEGVTHICAATPPKAWPKSQRAVIIKFCSSKKNAFVLLPFSMGKEIFGKTIICDRTKYDPLPFTDMRKNRH